MSDRTTSTAATTAQQRDQQMMTQAVAEREKKVPLKEVTKLSAVFTNEDFAARITQAVPKQLSPSRMIRSLIGSVQRSPDLLRCDVLDVVGKMLVCASVGLETDTPLGHAHLIPFENNVWNPKTRQTEKKFICQVIFGYHGLLDLSYRTGKLATINARCVWKAEETSGNFAFEFGTSRHLRHRPTMGEHNLSPEAQAENRADWPAWVYCHATMSEGLGDPFEVLPWSDIETVRNSAQAYRAALNALNKGKNAREPYVPRTFTEAPWVRHVRAMAMKTAFRRLSNWLPRTVELATIDAIEEAQQRGPLDFGQVIDSSDYDIMGRAGDIAGATSDPSAAFSWSDTDEAPNAPAADGGSVSAAGRGNNVAPGPSAPVAAPTTPPAAAEPPRRGPGRPRKADTAPAQQPTAQDDIPLPGEVRRPAAPAPAAPPVADAAPARHPEKPKPVEIWPVDDIGEPVFDGDNAVVFDSALGFATWFADTMVTTQRPDALRENNMDNIAEAHAGDPEAARIIDEALAASREPRQPVQADEPRAPEDAPAGYAPVDIPMTPGGRPHWPNYAEMCKSDLAQNVHTLDDITDWVAANEPTYGDKPIKASVERHIAARRGEIAPSADEGPGDAQEGPAEATTEADADEAVVANIIAEMKRHKTQKGMNEYANSGAVVVVVKRIKHEKPALFARLDAESKRLWEAAVP